MSDKTEENRQLLLEKYSFISEDGKKYFVKPATMEEMIDGSFGEKINIIGIPSLESNARLHFFSTLNDENKRKVLEELILKYITLNGEAVDFSKSTLSVDDLILVMLRLAGVSG